MILVGLCPSRGKDRSPSSKAVLLLLTVLVLARKVGDILLLSDLLDHLIHLIQLTVLFAYCAFSICGRRSDLSRSFLLYTVAPTIGV